MDGGFVKNLLFIGIGAAGSALICWGIGRWRMKRLMKRLMDMLDRAIGGDFQEKQFDESMESAVEQKLSRFLKSSELSARRLSEERDKIKELIADISHQTKTPISNLLLYSQLLGESELPEDCRPAGKEICKQAEKLQFLIVSLINLSRLETGIIQVRPRRGRLDELIEAVERQARPKAEGKGLAFSVQGSKAWALFDPKWTEEALYNLVDNALKYTPGGGWVEVAAREYEMFVCIEVRDNGIGIKEEEQGKIFGRFYRAEASGGEDGVGIGLFLAREIARAQGGYIKVKSAQGKGSSFLLYLQKDQRGPSTER